MIVMSARAREDAWLTAQRCGLTGGGAGVLAARGFGAVTCEDPRRSSAAMRSDDAKLRAAAKLMRKAAAEARPAISTCMNARRCAPLGAARLLLKAKAEVDLRYSEDCKTPLIAAVALRTEAAARCQGLHHCALLL